jgi:hypothetical protein
MCWLYVCTEFSICERYSLTHVTCLFAAFHRVCAGHCYQVGSVYQWWLFLGIWTRKCVSCVTVLIIIITIISERA